MGQKTRSSKSRTARRKKKNTAVLLDGGRCYLCRKRLRPDDATLDHVVPRCRGGTLANGNIRAACQPCNREKGDWTYTEMLLGFRLNTTPDGVG